MKKLTSLTITLGAMLMLGACGAKEETTVFQQELPSELQGKNLGSSDLKITHKGVKIIKVVSESEIPLTFGLGADELADAKKEIEDNAELSQEEKNNLLAEMEKELKNQSQNQSDNTKQQLISELGTARTQTAEKISELDSQKKLKQTDTNLFTLIANKDGVVHYLTPVKTGLGLQAFQPIAQMDKGKNSKLVGEVYISAQDRSKIKVGNTTKLSLAGVNQTKYGLLTGKIKSISDGTITQGSGEQTQVLYQVNVALDKMTLTSGGEEILAKASMPTVASIVYEKENYMEWLLEQLNFMKEK